MHDLQLIQNEVLQVMSAGVFLKGLVKVPYFESTEDCANIVLKTNGL